MLTRASRMGPIALLLATACEAAGGGVCPSPVFPREEVGAFVGTTEELAAVEAIGARCIRGTITTEATDAVDLGPLATVEVVTGDVEIFTNSQIRDLDGLRRLRVVHGDLRIRRQDGLASIAGLDRLEEVGGSLLVGDRYGASSPNRALTDAGDFASLRTIGGDLVFCSAHSLRRFPRFPALESVGGYVQICDNPTLAEVDAFPALHSIGGDLYFASNFSIERIAGFDTLRTVSGGSIVIADNYSLVRIDAFGGVTVAGCVTATDNFHLPECELRALADRIQARGCGGVPSSQRNCSDCACATRTP